MPRLVEQLLLKTFDSDQRKLYEAFQKTGSRDFFTAEGAGGLGDQFLYPETLEALNVDINIKKMDIIVKNIVKLKSIAERFRTGADKLGYDKSRNKYVICLALIIRQPTTLESIPIKADAFTILESIYLTKSAFKNQRMSAGGLVIDTILLNKKIFETEAAALNFTTHSKNISADQLHISPQTYSPSLISGISNSQSGSGSRTPPVTLDLTPRSQNAVSISQYMTSMNGEHKYDYDDEVKEQLDRAMTRRNTKETVQEMLTKMITETRPRVNNMIFSLKERKVSQKVYFSNHIYDLNFRQAQYLSNYMYDVQRNRVNEPNFDDIRAETNRLRLLFGYQKGSTQTWQEIANNLQERVLQDLIKSRPDNYHKLPLQTSQWTTWSNFFGRSYARTKWGTPAVYKKFKECCREIPEGESPAQPTRSLSDPPSQISQQRRSSTS